MVSQISPHVVFGLLCPRDITGGNINLHNLLSEYLGPFGLPSQIPWIGWNHTFKFSQSRRLGSPRWSADSFLCFFVKTFVCTRYFWRLLHLLSLVISTTVGFCGKTKQDPTNKNYVALVWRVSSIPGLFSVSFRWLCGWKWSVFCNF